VSNAKNATKEFPLGFIELERPVGWDRSRFLQLGRASWNFTREGFALVARYRNLLESRDWELGVVSPATTNLQILEWVAGHYESHTASDWVRIDDQIFAFTADRGDA
jgi:hypothetical protein